MTCPFSPPILGRLRLRFPNSTMARARDHRRLMQKPHADRSLTLTSLRRPGPGRGRSRAGCG